MKQRTLSLCLAILLIPALAWADTFSPMGTRWPSGLKKNLTGNTTTLFAANGDSLSAYSKTPFAPTGQTTLSAPEGIIAIDCMKVGTQTLVVAACGTGGLQIIAYDATTQTFGAPLAAVTQSETARATATAPAALNIKGCVGFTSQGEHLIATVDDNFGFRVFRLNTALPAAPLTEVIQQELSVDAFTMLVDLARWERPTGNDRILTIAKNRELGLHEISKTPLGTWHIDGLSKSTIDIPNLPSTQLLYFSSLTLTVAGDKAHVIENSLGNYFCFTLVETGETAIVQASYPAPGETGIAFGYPLDLVTDTQHAYISTLMEKDQRQPGVQVVQLTDNTVVGTLKLTGAGALHRDASTASLFLMDLKRGLTKIDVSDKANPAAVGASLPTPFAAIKLLSRENYLFVVDGVSGLAGGLRVLDIGNATQPKRLHFIPTPGRAMDIATDADFYRLFVADGAQGVQCYSMNSNLIPEGKTPDDFGGDGKPPIPSPKAPCHLQTLSPSVLGGNAVKVTVTYKNIQGINTSFLHILTDANTLVSMALPTDETTPAIDTASKKQLSLPGSPHAIGPFMKDYILVAAGAAGFLVVDLFSDAATPDSLVPAIEASRTDGLSNAVSVSSDGSRYAYVADDTAGLVAFDLFSHPETPAIIQLSRVGGYALATGHFLDLFVTDNHNLYAVTDQNLDNIQIFDLSNPSAITHLGSETTLGSPQAVIAATTGGFSPDSPALRAAYIADGQGGLAIRQTTNDDNAQVQTWKDETTACFIRATH